MKELLSTVPLTFLPLFVAIDVFWVTSLVAPYVEGKDTRAVRRVAGISVLTALLVSLGFAAVGELFFNLIGITVDDFKVAGGILLLVLSIMDLIRPGQSTMLVGESNGVVPLGIPLIAGPALLTTLLVLMEHYGVVPTLIGLAANMLILWLCLLGVRRIVRLIPHAFLVALSKILSLILASIAVMMIRLGLEGMLG